MFTTTEDLRQECLKCQKCPLHETRTNVVFGVGKTDAKILFISEKKLKSIFLKYPQASINYIEFLSDKVRFLNKKETGMIPVSEKRITECGW